MDRGIFVALSGAVLQERRLEALTDNLANVNTAGFKKQKPVFEDAMPNPWSARTFARSNGVSIDMSQGMTEKTDRKLDVAIKGDGFFVVNTKNGPRYTRDGNFAIGVDGTLLTREGYKVQGESGVIKLTSPDVTIDASGNVQEKGVTIDRLKLVSFNKPEGLTREAGLFVPSDPAVKETRVSDNTQLEQGYIEVSNVNAVKAMTTMIEAMRSYETHAKMIQTMDDMTRKAIEEVGRV
ncbi:MAG: flagellar basal-body rod protein FlgF [Deltaproteobacteria bacterium]|nr:flagellar basal-body rod protein FlgF [Deltaproteobacteria bacterium]